MGNRLTRGNLLATLKELKKMPRPKVGVSNASVQAICSSSSAMKPSKSTDVRATIDRRRTLLQNGTRNVSDSIEYLKCKTDFLKFVEAYKNRKGFSGEGLHDASQDEINGSCITN